MNFLDVLSAMIVGLYFVAVAIHGNTAKLMEYAKRDKAFLKWAIAVAILAYLYSIKEIRGPAGLLIACAFILFFLQNVKTISDNAAKAWAGLSN